MARDYEKLWKDLRKFIEANAQEGPYTEAFAVSCNIILLKMIDLQRSQLYNDLLDTVTPRRDLTYRVIDSLGFALTGWESFEQAVSHLLFDTEEKFLESSDGKVYKYHLDTKTLEYIDIL